MNVSKKVIAQTLAHVVALIVGYVAARQGIHVSPTVSAEVAGLASVVCGPLAGWTAREEPSADAVVGKVLATLTSAGVSPRSILSGAQTVLQTLEAPTPTVQPSVVAEPVTGPRSNVQDVSDVGHAANAMPE